MTKSQLNKLYEFLGKSVVKYSSLGININFKAQKDLIDGVMKYTGSADKKELYVATGKDLEYWFSVFVHETCHLDQTIETPEFFAEAENNMTRMDRWLRGVYEYSEKVLDEIFESVIQLEHDCETRAVQKIKSEKLPINLRKYIRAANAYILDYQLVKKHRDWNNIRSRKQMYDKLPNRLVSLEKALKK